MAQHPNERYKGWRVWSLTNPWLKLHIAPQLGGRIIQLELNKYDFFFVNPSLEGKEPGGNRLGEQGAWLNFGGEKIWPAPQGWNSPDMWPGPPDPVLDSGIYSVEETEGDSPNQLQLISPVDSHTGLQIIKAITLSENRSEVIIQATFINRSPTLREWSVWPVFQMNTPDFQSGERYQVTCPVNPASCFDQGYKVMHGLVNNPQYALNDVGNLVVDYQYLIGKVGLDANANWVAFCDKVTGKVFVTSYQYQTGASYPENTSVQIWTQGRGLIYSRNRLAEYPNDPTSNPPYLELELLSPLQKMQPDEQASFEYRLLACTVPAGTNVQQANNYGVVADSLTAIVSDGSIRITGKFGVFSQGVAKLQFEDHKGDQIETLRGMYAWNISPCLGLDIDVQLLKTELAFDTEFRVKLVLYDQDNLFMGEMAQTNICNT